MLLFHQFTAMFNSLFVFPSEFKMMVKERSSGMYRLSAFYFARTFSELPLDCTIPSLLIIIMYWMTGLRPTAGAFISHWLAVLLSRLIGQSLGLLVGAAILNFKSASTVCSLVSTSPVQVLLLILLCLFLGAARFSIYLLMDELL